MMDDVMPSPNLRPLRKILRAFLDSGMLSYYLYDELVDFVK